MSDTNQSLTTNKNQYSETYYTFEDENDTGVERSFKVADAIEHIGFGRFQVCLGLVAGIAWIADGMEVMVISILGPVLVCEWHIDVYQEAMLTTVVFLGYLIGSPAFGWIGDKFGRRHALMMSSSWVSTFGILSALATNLYWLYTVRFLVGFGVGGSVQFSSYYAEFIPNKYRGRCILLIAVFSSIGGSLTTILAIFIMLPYGMEWWLAACSVPSMLFVGLCAVFGYCLEWMPRSPHFDVITNNKSNAYKTLKLMAHCNNCNLPEGTIIAEQHVPRGRICDLWRPGFKLTSVLLAILWFLTGFSYYGVVLFSAELLAVGGTCIPDVFGDADNNTCEVFEIDDFVNLLLTSLAEIPGLVITALLIDKIGRKATLTLENIVYGVTCLLLIICMEGPAMVFLLLIMRSIGLSSLESLLVYTPEFYPTQIRALSTGMGSMFSRVATMLSPYVSEVLVSKSLYYGIGIYAGIGLLLSFVAFLLPVETKGKSLTTNGWPLHRTHSHRPVCIIAILHYNT